MRVERFEGRVDEPVSQIHSGPTARGVDRIYVPGETERESREQALTEGIALLRYILTDLAVLAEDVGKAPLLAEPRT